MKLEEACGNDYCSETSNQRDSCAAWLKLHASTVSRLLSCLITVQWAFADLVCALQRWLRNDELMGVHVLEARGIAAAVFAAGLLAGCSNGFGVPDRAAFLEQVRNGAPDAQYLTDEQILEVGESACTQFAEGKTIEDLRSVEAGVTDETRQRINVTHRAAADHLCPGSG